MFATIKRRSLLAAAALSVAALGLATGVEAASYRLGHHLAASSPVGMAAQEFADVLRERSNGEIDISVFPDGQVGDVLELARGMQLGTIGFAFISPGNLTGLDQTLDFNSLPFVVSNFEEADKIYYGDGIIPRTIRDGLGNIGIRLLAFTEQEFRSITNSRHPVTSLADIRGLKLRVSPSAVMRTFFEEAGAQTVTMAFAELFTGLQQGVVEGQDNGPILTYSSGLHETQKYMTLTNHVYPPGVITISEAVWQGLSPELQQMVTDVANEVSAKQIVAARAEYNDYVQRIRDAGIEVAELSPEALAEFRDFGRSIWDKLAPIYGQERIDELRAEVAALEN